MPGSRIVAILLAHLVLCSFGNPDRNVPDFFVIGVQKGGTTSLNDLFWQNREICSTSAKEKHFFDKDNNFQGGYQTYVSQYQMCPKNIFTIDATPVFQEFQVPGRLATTYSKSDLRSKKFILLLREPVSREFSLYEHKLRECNNLINHRQDVKNFVWATISCNSVMLDFDHHKNHFNPMSFRQYYLQNHLHKANSNYVLHLNNWLEHIDRHQIFIVSMETLISNTTDTMSRLQNFLGLSSGWGGHVELPHDNDSSHMDAVLDCQTYDELFAYYRSAHKNLYDLISRGRPPPTEPPFHPFSSTRSKCVSPGNKKRAPSRQHNTSPRTNVNVSSAANANLRVGNNAAERDSLVALGDVSAVGDFGDVALSDSGDSESDSNSDSSDFGDVAAGDSRDVVAHDSGGSDSDSSNFAVGGIVEPQLSQQQHQQSIVVRAAHVFLIGVEWGGHEVISRLLQLDDSMCVVDMDKHLLQSDEHDSPWLGEAHIQLFEGCDASQVYVDSTPVFYNRHAPTELLEFYSANDLAAKKFILVLREPVSRDLANYYNKVNKCLQLVKSGALSNTSYGNLSMIWPHCAEVIPSEAHMLNYSSSPGSFKALPFSAAHPTLAASVGAAANDRRAVGHYREHLEAWLKVVTRQQLMILNYETLLQNTTDTLRRVSAFLQQPVDWQQRISEVTAVVGKALLLSPLDSADASATSAAIVDIDCSYCGALAAQYDKWNEGLGAILEDAGRPVEEPHFPPFDLGPVLRLCTDKHEH